MSETASNLALAESSDAVLIARIRGGDVAAYGLLYERHLGSARKLARSLVDGDRAEDAVQDTFTKILDVLRRGGGPQAGFRPYLLTAVRRTVYDRYRSEKRLQPTDQIELYDPGEPFVDPALEGLERSMIVRAYRSLPERWQAVLWHTEIEGAKPADVAPLLGLTANGVAALAYRAREGLRQAYLQMHLAGATTGEIPEAATAAGAAAAVGAAAAPITDERCRAALDKLGAYVRGGLAKRETKAVEKHLDDCERCKAIYLELADVNTALREALGPIILGSAVAAYLAAAKGGAAAGGIITWFRHLPKRQQQVLSGGMAAVAAAAVLGLLLVSHKEPIKRVHKPPTAAEPATPPKPKPRPRAPKPPPPPAPKPKPKPAPKKPKPKPPPPAAPAPPPHLTARIGTVGTLLRDQPGIVAMSVNNGGGGPSRDLTADVDLPPGVTYAGGPTGRNSAIFKPAVAPGDDWSCRPITGGAKPADPGLRLRCTHEPLKSGAATSAYLHVNVGTTAPYGTPPQVTLRSGDQQAATAKAQDGVAQAGLPARFAVDGHVRTVATGNALLSCDAKQEHGCAKAQKRQGDHRDNDFWDMAPLDLDHDASTKSSSSARLDVPSGSKVLWAGLYWSGVAGDGCGPVTAKIRPPGGTYTSIRSSRAECGRLPDFSAYQAFADVTDLVRSNGGGEWWGADVPTRAGTSHYAGWSLVVVVNDPKAPYQQAMVLDGARALGPDAAERVDVPVNGLLATAQQARIGVVAWEGDADLKGDRVLLDGRPLQPAAGGGIRSADNALDSSAAGAIGPALTFGVDVGYFAATLDSGKTLSLTSKQDAYLAGVVTVTAPMRS
ncbi:sigma-70 family RNA polymerase sigma factor [Actinomadura barringtoniae]|uniref:sigma-70 family RNA polymerase sigma factor n=1 Tax=Actinomadura barringtoniae TaxID=1427535 RepID=UPI0027DBC8B0|nr:sigma-70 family RNA polymerase sigma factor [Actinomadura barringtoniae]